MKQKKKLLLIAMVLALSQTSCHRPSRQTNAPIPKSRSAQADSEAILAIRRYTQEVLNRGDAQALAGLFTEDAVFLLPDGNSVKGKEAIINWHKDFFRENPGVQTQFTRECIRFPRQDVAIETVSYVEKHAGKPAIHGGDTTLFVKQQGGWLIDFVRIHRPAAQTEANKALVRRWIEEGINKGNLAVCDEAFAPDFVLHTSGGDKRGLQGPKQAVKEAGTAFPDLRLTIKNMVAEADMVAVHWTSMGTHQGEFIGRAATGKKVTQNGIYIYRLEAGKIHELWSCRDDLGLAMQLGIVELIKEGKRVIDE